MDDDSEHDAEENMLTKLMLCQDVARLDPHFAYKALNNTDSLHLKHYIIRTLYVDSVLFSALYANIPCII